ncbi:hypothetical protein [Streptomyces sp. 8L]|uniref:hypothetical protein n=1 Tax=Streptomyces sp. 8L TaxID=2877242 RepID=UPI001CD74DD0|nr:hypothetical protein [Streptomyces sp. 8L]MCA1217443.1 hypothetical protein [Streptomyces sp. 8L]
MSIDWSALGEVAGVSIGATVAVVVLFALGVRVLSGPGPDGEPLAGAAETDGEGAPGSASVAPLPVFVAGLCFLACLAAVAYGLYLIIPQFH